MTAYYNENDPPAAAWLRTLIQERLLPQGYVDERSIEDVRPGDLAGFVQCHFFAGIGGWPEALRLAGWPEDRPVWTGSCPCQSFSAAGKGKGFADERHLWPAWHHLISQCGPPVVFGEQVDAAIKHGWLDLVQTDMEALGYAFGSAVIPAAGVGAPHGRHRIWFVANTALQQFDRIPKQLEGSIREEWRKLGSGSATGIVGNNNNNNNTGLEGRAGMPKRADQCAVGASSVAGGVVIPESEQARVSRFARESRATAGYWSAADWIPCTDDKWRPVEPGTFPLAHGVPNRVVKLRGYGNAIVPQVAAEFIKAAI